MKPMSTRPILPALAWSVLILAVGCSAATEGPPPVYRGITIVDDRFYPAAIVAPAAIPIILELTHLNPGSLDVAIPSLGLPHISVPGNLIIQNSTKSAPAAFARARQPLGRLTPGNYEIECRCKTHSVTTLIVTAGPKEQAD